MGPTSNNYTREVYILLRDKDTGEGRKIPVVGLPNIQLPSCSEIHVTGMDLTTRCGEAPESHLDIRYIPVLDTRGSEVTLNCGRCNGKSLLEPIVGKAPIMDSEVHVEEYKSGSAWASTVPQWVFFDIRWNGSYSNKVKAALEEIVEHVQDISQSIDSGALVGTEEIRIGWTRIYMRSDNEIIRKDFREYIPIAVARSVNPILKLADSMNEIGKAAKDASDALCEFGRKLSLPVIELVTTPPAEKAVVFRATWPGRAISKDTVRDIHARIGQVLDDFVKDVMMNHTANATVLKLGTTNDYWATFGIRSDDNHVLYLAKEHLAEQVRVRIAPIFDPTVQAEQVHKALEVCASNPDGDTCKQCPYGCLYNCSPAYQEALDYINKLESDIAAKKLMMNSVYGKAPMLETVADKINYTIRKQWDEELAKMISGGFTFQNKNPIGLISDEDISPDQMYPPIIMPRSVKAYFKNDGLCSAIIAKQIQQEQEKEKTTMPELKAWGSDARVNLVPQIADVYFNEKKGATTVRWADGTVTTVKLMQGDTYDRENGFMRCVMKKLFEERHIDPKTGEPTKDDRPNKYRRVIKGWLKADDIRKEQEAKAAAKKAEKKAKKKGEDTKSCSTCGWNTNQFPDTRTTCSCKEECCAWNKWIERPIRRSCDTCGRNTDQYPSRCKGYCKAYSEWTPKKG